MMISHVILGLHGAINLVFVLPEMIDAGSELYPDDKMKSEVNDVSSGIFNMFLGIGQICGPIYCSTVKEYWGFRHTCDSLAMMCPIFALIYYLTSFTPPSAPIEKE